MAPLVVVRVLSRFCAASRALTISDSSPSSRLASELLMDSRFSSVAVMLATFLSLSTWSRRSTMRLAVSVMFCSADGAVWITGASRLSTLVRAGACGVPPLSWMMVGPVRLVMASFARVSVFTGVYDSTRMRAITWRGSLGASDSLVIEPTAMPLYCTGLPTDRPVTASRNTTWYSCHVRSDEYLAAHNPNSSSALAMMRVKAPMRT